MRCLVASVALLAIASAGGLALTRRAPAVAAFPGAGGLIAFTSTRDGNEEIYVMRPDGSDLVRLTNQPTGDSHPAWTADGSRIAFDSGRDDPSLDLYVMDDRGGNLTRLIDSPGEDWEAAWSPDGTKIAFGSARDGDVDVYVMNTDGTGLTQLTDAPGIDRHVVFSPDGTKMAFRSARDGGDGEVYVMNPDGSAQTNLSNSPGFDSRPAWSPDGSLIAFNSSRDGNSEIYVMNADGSNQTRLTSNTAVDDSPAWSPDGTKLVFVSNRTGDLDIFSMDPNGSNQTNLTNSPGADSWPDWQPFIDDDGDGCATYRETGSEPAQGGMRDPQVFWDFFDVPLPGHSRDRSVTIGDIAAVVARFGSYRTPPPSKAEALAEALTSPPAAPEYHAAYDRTYVGPDRWDLGTPDGYIAISDVARAVAQFGHSCA